HIPSESTFSRAFAEFAFYGLGDTVHKALVDTHLSGSPVILHGMQQPLQGMKNLLEKRRKNEHIKKEADQKRERYGN
ncbi:MAG: hypothetical protein C0392_15020, partial [Syntrophus sp. (in: bacteria)]|nr:hypothetical protein [Syntrophus sp. (in: bacteria)]